MVEMAGGGCGLGAAGRDDAFTILRYEVETAVWRREFVAQDGYILQMTGLGGVGVLAVVSPLQSVSGKNKLTNVYDMQINGRFLSLSGLDGVRSVLYLYNVDTAETTEYELAAPNTPARWSADSQWLLIPQGTSLRLAAPSIGYEKQVFHDLAACDTAVWVGTTNGGRSK